MKCVVLESPFMGRGETEEERTRNATLNLQYARDCVRDSLLRGEAPIASHLLYTQPSILRDEVPEERKWGIAAGLAWVSRAEYSVYYTDRGWSSGMRDAFWRYHIQELRPFRIRSVYNPAQLPTILDQEVETFMRAHIDPPLVKQGA